MLADLVTNRAEKLKQSAAVVSKRDFTVLLLLTVVVFSGNSLFTDTLSFTRCSVTQGPCQG
jgi:hypothetical protein